MSVCIVFEILISFFHRKSGWEKSSERESCHGSSRSDQAVTVRHNFCRSVFFIKSGCGSDNFSYHYNARRFFGGSFLERATISLIIPRTLLTIIKAYINNYAQTEKNKLPSVDVRFISLKHYHEQIILNSVDICLWVAISAKILLYNPFLRFARTKV